MELSLDLRINEKPLKEKRRAEGRKEIASQTKKTKKKGNL
jgi:hypothetical protein